MRCEGCGQEVWSSFGVSLVRLRKRWGKSLCPDCAASRAREGVPTGLVPRAQRGYFVVPRESDHGK